MIKKYLGELAETFTDILFPPVCPVCDDPVLISESGKLCRKCKDLLKPIKQPFCYMCGRPLDNNNQEKCRLCTMHKYHMDRGIAVYVYDAEPRRMILKLKYNGRRDIAKFFINSTMENHGEYLKNLAADAVLPIPVHINRRKKRGYNQSEILAKLLAERLGVLYIDDILFRIKDTVAQKQLGSVGRIKNIYDAFEVDSRNFEWYQKHYNLSRVILVDDIFTTGSTIHCCAYALKQAGVKEVYSVSMCIATNDQAAAEMY